MSTEEENQTVFDVAAASMLTKELRDVFASGKTRSYEWRISQLKSMIKMCEEHEEDIVDALHQDLSKPKLESIVYEITMLKNSCALAIKELKQWMMPEKVVDIG